MWGDFVVGRLLDQAARSPLFSTRFSARCPTARLYSPSLGSFFVVGLILAHSPSSSSSSSACSTWWISGLDLLTFYQPSLRSELSVFVLTGGNYGGYRS